MIIKNGACISGYNWVFLECEGLLCNMFIVQHAFNWEVHKSKQCVFLVLLTTLLYYAVMVFALTAALNYSFIYMERKESNTQHNLKFAFVHSFIILFEKQRVNIFWYPYILLMKQWTQTKMLHVDLTFLSVMFCHSTLYWFLYRYQW